MSGIDWGAKLSQKVLDLKPSGIREFFDIVAERDDCISLGVGEPDFVSPHVVVESAIEGLRNGYTHYTGNQGLPSLRRTVAEYIDSEYGISYEPDNEVLITVGVSEGIDIALRSMLNRDEAVMYVRPNYVSYDPMIQLAGGISCPVDTSFENGFQLTRADIEAAYRPGIKALLLNYPCNPTGAGMSNENLADIAEFVKEKDLLVISDEIYGELTYEGSHIPFSSLPGMKERTLLLAGLSKSFAMTGWRIGYAAGPEHWVKAMNKIHQYSMLCAPTISQLAAEAALKRAKDDRDRMKKAYRRRRDLIVDGLNEMGLECLRPEGAFYVFPKISTTGLSAMQFARKLLDEESVAVVPGTAFSPHAEEYIRCSYATSEHEIETALRKIKSFVGRHQNQSLLSSK